MTTESDVLQGTTATYVFAVCRHIDAAALARLPGLTDNALVRGLPFGALTAVVQDVPADQFEEEAWRRRLSVREELERCARAHHDVVTATTDSGPTVPLALATLYRGDERARQALGEDEARFTAVLDRIEGHVEWGVKVYLSPTAPRPSESGPPTLPQHADRSERGRAYLERKRGMHRAREQQHDRSLQTAEDVDAGLCCVATASRRLRPHSQEMTGERHRQQILNAAYLVPAERAGELAAAVARVRRSTGAHIELSGPWAPYSFAGEL